METLHLIELMNFRISGPNGTASVGDSQRDQGLPRPVDQEIATPRSRVRRSDPQVGFTNI